MNDIKIFNNEEFGDIRTVTIDREPWFVGKDVADILGYQNGSRDINRHVDEEDRHKVMLFDGNQDKETIIINESGLYSLILSSKMPNAKKFKHWVTSEVLPSIRKTGAYEVPKSKKNKSNRPGLPSVNMMVKNVMSALEKVKVEPIFVAAEVKRLYTDLGYEVKAPLITDEKVMPKLYDCTEIAKELGIMSMSGKPHNQAVADIIRKISLSENETKRTAFSRNGHDDITVQYLPSVVNKIKNWLEENGYPTRIPFVDASGCQKFRTVVYECEE